MMAKLVILSLVGGIILFFGIMGLFYFWLVVLAIGWLLD